MCIPFDTPEFISAWDMWKKHKKEKDFYPYTETAENQALSSLFKKCHGNEKLAIEAIEISIEKNWFNIYPPKNEHNGTNIQRANNQNNSTQLITGNVGKDAFGKL